MNNFRRPRYFVAQTSSLLDCPHAFSRRGRLEVCATKYLAVFLLLASFALTPSAAPLTPERIAALPSAGQAAWQNYLARSQAAARANQSALEAELAAHKLASATRAPDAADFKLPKKFGDAWYASDEARRLADTILSYQTPSGGWSKHTGYSKGPRQPGMLYSSQYAPENRPHYLATFDNRSTTEQLQFLACMWHATQRDACKTAFMRGLDFIFDAQYPNGGWPQVYPVEGGYHDSITFNDDAMTHILELLRDIANNDPRFSFVDSQRREKSAAALASGIRCILQAQVAQSGKKTVWCAQHDALTLQPAEARKMEPAMLSGLESSRILEFLMALKNPSPEIIAAIECGLAWFESAKITGISRVNRDGKTLYEANPASTEIYWARFYNVSDSKPVFPGRDGVVYDSFAAMVAAGNKLGYAFYTTLPGSMLNVAQKKWRKQLPPVPPPADIDELPIAPKNIANRSVFDYPHTGEPPMPAGLKPLFDVRIRDTSVCVGPDGTYYLTGTTGENIWESNEGIHLWKSKDLKNWELIGLVWSIERDGSWQKQWTEKNGKRRRAVWAPEVHYIKGNFYLAYCITGLGTGVLRSTTGKPEGPYRSINIPDAPITRGIDASLFEDDDGAVYFLYGSGYLARMKDDLSGLAEAPVRLRCEPADRDIEHHHPNRPCVERELDHIGYEGAALFKRNGRYYLSGAERYYERYHCMVAEAADIRGPYGARYVGVPYAGHNNFFRDNDGNWWATIFGNDKQAPFSERPGILRADFDAAGHVRPLVKENHAVYVPPSKK